MTSEDDGAVHSTSWTIKEAVAAIEQGGVYLMRTPNTDNFEAWCRDWDDAEATANKFGIIAVPLEWVYGAFPELENIPKGTYDDAE